MVTFLHNRHKDWGNCHIDGQDICFSLLRMLPSVVWHEPEQYWLEAHDLSGSFCFLVSCLNQGRDGNQSVLSWNYMVGQVNIATNMCSSSFIVIISTLIYTVYIYFEFKLLRNLFMKFLQL